MNVVTRRIPREKLQELLDVTRELFGEGELNEEQMSRLFDRRHDLSLILADRIGVGRIVMRGLVDTLVGYEGLKREAAPEDVVMVLNAFGWNVEVSE